MAFDSFTHAQSFILWATFGIALVMGALVNKTNFCTMGAVSDWVNMGDTGRLRAWMFAIAIALLGVAFLETKGLVSFTDTFPPYRAKQLIWAENLIGGLMFGIGMTLASGCGNKTLIRIGGGNLKSIVVLAIIAVIAYYMTNPLPGSDKTLFSMMFYNWLRPLAVTLSTNQDLGAIVGGADAGHMRLTISVVLGLVLAGFAFMSNDFRSNFDNILGGLVVGLAVLAFWYATGHATLNIDGQTFSLNSFVSDQWDMYADPNAIKPADSRQLAAQSFTFINPMGQTFGYAMAGFKSASLTFGVVAVAGVVLGSLLWSLVSRSFRIEWFASFGDFVSHVVGAVLMGFGGVLAMGCTIGQGITGVSTLALGSIITLLSIVTGSAGMMKYQYWRMMREG